MSAASRVAWVGVVLVSRLLAADPAGYQRGGTWPETMLAARESQLRAAAAEPQAGGFRPYVSTVRRGGDAPVRVVVDVSTVAQLWLIATVGGDDYNFDQAIWGEPTLVAADGTRTRLSALQPASAKVGWGRLYVDRNHTGAPLRIAGQTFAHGFWAHAPSELCFALERRYRRFEAYVGLDAGAGSNGTAAFKVLDHRDVADDAAGDLWTPLARDFASATDRREMAWERRDHIWDGDWPPGDYVTLARRYAAAAPIAPLAAEAAKRAAAVRDASGLRQLRALYVRARELDRAFSDARALQLGPVLRAVSDLTATCGDRYPQGPVWLAQLRQYEQALPQALVQAKSTDLATVEQAARTAAQAVALARQALLANPALDFQRLLLVKRRANQLGLPQNWQSNSSLPRRGFDNEVASLPLADLDGPLTTVYRPQEPVFVGDVDLHYTARRLLFSSLDARQRWQVFEVGIDGGGLRQVTPTDAPEVDHYDACYLPDGRIMFTSTAPMIGVPCVFGSDHVSTLFRCDADGSHVRQLGFEQDHDWCPTVLHDGRVLYTRWEYTDTPHSNTRLLFTMNPDGTGQREYLGSNSYWPNSFFYARPLPGHPTKVVAIISGHHGVPRMGELVVFDPARGRHEAGGVVQRLPGHGQPVQPVIRDALVEGSWPKFLHPFPLNEKYFLVAAKPSPQALWGLYLVDVFDNLTLLREEPDYALLEPVPLKPTAAPPAIPDRVDERRRDAVVQIQDIYAGPGLAGLPRGTVKRLRVFGYEFAYHGMGGLLGVLGIDGPWDIRRIMGTVPVEPDGSANFRVPANTPISIQPLDSDGQALQLMRSWMTAMPGELLSCVGCHEQQSSTPVARRPLAMGRPPSPIRPWYGPTRGFSYQREVQPVVDRHCLRCHGENGQPPDLRGDRNISDWAIIHPGNGGSAGGRFSLSYAALHRYVRRPGIESDYHLLAPMEFHAGTTELVQMLRKGHHGVQLDAESWDRLICWIDFNTVYHGTWTDAGHKPGRQREQRRELLRRYADVDEDPEAEAGGPPATLAPVAARAVADTPPTVAPAAAAPGWPFDAGEAQRRQRAAATVTHRQLDLGAGIKLDLALVPAGAFIMGDRQEGPPTAIGVDRPYWMARCEVSNAQYARFDASHDSGVESKLGYQFGIHGYPLNQPEQPVVRVSWLQATAFCRWLAQQVGEDVRLPTEAEWEYACRAGTATPFWFGDLDTDFSRLANLGDAKLRELASDPYTLDKPLANPGKYDDWVPHETRFNDGSLVTAPIGRYQPNPWGLHDLHGNVAEWTGSSWRAYPYRDDDGRNDASPAAEKVVRGGSWYDRPQRCTSAFRLAYRAHQPVFNVGFRVVVTVKAVPERARQAAAR